MPTPQIPNISDNASLEEMRDCYIGMQRYLSYLLSTLDTLNISRLDAKVIIAESITAGKLAADSVQTENLQAGAITTEKLEAGAVTAEKITVDELSAISADLGTITAGLIQSIQIFGSYIATRNGEYPRSEMSDTDDLFAAYKDASNFVKIQPSIAGAPAIRFTSNDIVIGSINSALGDLEIWAPDVLRLTAPQVQVQNLYQIYSRDDELSLGDILDEIRDQISNKADIIHTHSVTIPNHNHGNPDNATSGGGTFTTS